MMKDFGTIDVTMTTISSRLPALHETLLSLLAQNYDDLRVNLYLSEEPYLLDQGVTDLPDDIRTLAEEANGRLLIHTSPNWGPYRKLLPFLRANWGQSRLVTTADDDTVYPASWLQGLVDAYDTYRCVVGYRGHPINISDGEIKPYRSWMRSRIEENPGLLILPTGKDGVLYNTAFFPISVLNVADAIRIAPTVDDLWFRWHLMLNRIPVHVIHTDYASQTFQETDYDGSLYRNFNKDGGNDIAVTALQNYCAGQFGFDAVSLQ